MGDLPDDSNHLALLYTGKYLIYLAYDVIWLSDESFSSWTKFGYIESADCDDFLLSSYSSLIEAAAGKDSNINPTLEKRQTGNTILLV